MAATETVGDIHDVKNYYVLVLMMAGVIDDFKDALNELLRAANLPISIFIVKMGQNTEDNDSEKFIQKALPAFEESERVFVDLIDFDNYRDTDGKYGPKDSHNEFYSE